MSVKDIFGGFFSSPNSPQQTAAHVATGAPVNAPPGSQTPGNTSSTLGTEANVNVAPNGVIPKQEEKKDESPLAQFNSLWEPAKTPAPGSTPVSFNADPAKLMEAAGKIDFAQVVTPALIADITAGGEKAAAALVQSLQKVAQTVYAQSAFASTKIAEKAVADARTSFEASLPSLVRKQGLGESLAQDNPALNSPAVRPIIEAIQTQLATKYPNATETELLGMAKEYMSAASNAMSPTAKVTTTKGKGGEDYDWSKFLSAS
jgi:hypothetical protein